MIEEDGLCIMAAGLGWQKVLAVMLQLQTERRRDPKERGVVLVLGCTDWQRTMIKRELHRLDPALQHARKVAVAPDAMPQPAAAEAPAEASPAVALTELMHEAGGLEPEMPVDVTNEITAAGRIELYRGRACLFVTTRILVVDMLNSRVMPKQIAGMIIMNAHRVTENSGEGFAARLYRSTNRKGYLRAFSDQPTSFSHGFAKVCCLWFSLQRFLWSLKSCKTSLCVLHSCSHSETTICHASLIMVQPSDQTCMDDAYGTACQ